MNRHHPFATPLRAAALLVLTSGCGFFDTTPRFDGGSTDTAFGFGKPTLQVMVGGQRFGPAAPDNGSSAQFANMRDNAGRVVQSRFTVLGSVGGGAATCALAFERDGQDGIAPIAARSYLISGGNTAVTPDGTVAPTAGQAVAVPQAVLQCSGTQCAGGAFVLTALDATHAEGYASGTWADSQGRGFAGFTCSFWLPMSLYQP